MSNRLLKPGDYGVLAASTALCGVLLMNVLGQDAAKAVVRSGGKVVAELNLQNDQEVKIQGALGPSVVEVSGGRVRVASDPSPRQICVRQGWLQRAGDAAICLPNQVTVELVARNPAYDSLTY